ncbi:MAG: protein translocase subunit SecF [Atopobiaceae bacterium]|jgi:preprotein translocase subunit SecF/SecD/SecF fusion protein|nr:protein translocase subunit SecF [Atopobiaceae bacterium]MCI2172819.1 protein translocase subunit SecF [Atopobiaceae bacterium]MCI2207126.1 protein translocase subunit SecF [Atopobiaceae bacterium]
MRSHFSREIPFIQHRKQFLIVSAILVTLAIVGICCRGLVLGIEFSGGTEIDFRNTGDITIEQMRSALADVDEGSATVQTAVTDGADGFLVRSDTTDPTVATEHATKAAGTLGLSDDSYKVTTIGPDWGSDITKSSAEAFIVAILVIIAYVSIRYEFKMSLTAVASLMHDLIITVGIYAWTQTAITPNVIAALLTIMGYSLYDTVVVFHRMNENATALKDGKHRTFYQIANFSINEVFVRTINTSITSLVPVIAMIVFGGSTLRDFAFAMAIGLVLGAYSTIGVASPLLSMWKTHEEKWTKLERRYGWDAIAAAEAPAAVEAAEGTTPASADATESDGR